MHVCSLEHFCMGTVRMKYNKEAEEAGEKSEYGKFS